MRSDKRGRQPTFSALRSAAGLPVGILLLLALWSVQAERIAKPYILPPPMSVARSWIDNREALLRASGATLEVVLLGFLVGFGTAAVLGFAISKSRPLENFLMPYLIASQAVPVIAVAPLLLMTTWSGLGVKIIVTAVTVFFPMLVNTIVGLRGIAGEQRDLMRLLSANRWQTLWKLEIPAAMPVLLAGLRVGVTLSVIGAVVAEFLKPPFGLGSLILTSRYSGPDALVFAALLTLVTLALLLYGLAAGTERLILSRR
jgi:NitT/TauT family transport system permease protein